MKFSEFIVKSLELRQALRTSHRALWLLSEVARGSAIMALILVVADAADLDIFADNPVSRLAFIGMFALLMTGIEALRSPVVARDAP